MSRQRFAVTIAALALAAAGCSTPVAERNPEEGLPALTWPAAPEQARIRLVRTATGPEDFGISKSMFRRMLDAVTGNRPQKFVRPTGVVERNAVLYVADPGAPAVWIIDAVRNEATRVSEVDDVPLQAPVAVAARPDGAVFVADSALRRIFLLDRGGRMLPFRIGEDLARPAALAYDAASGRLYAADSAGDRIHVYDAQGRKILSWGGSGSGNGEFNHPTHLALDANGGVLVTDALNFRVQAFTADGNFLWKFGHHGDGSGDLAAPKGVAFDVDGHVYIVDAVFGEQGTGRGQFWLPGGLCVNARGEIYVADTYNRRVQVFAAAQADSGGPK